MRAGEEHLRYHIENIEMKREELLLFLIFHKEHSWKILIPSIYLSVRCECS